MFSADYRWFLLHPLVRGGLLSLAIAALCVACLLSGAAASSTVSAPGLLAAAAPAAQTATAEQGSALPRTVLRLWFLVPHILPRS